MQRCILLVMAALLCACAESAPPQIGVIVSMAPRRAAEVAAEERARGDAGFFEPLMPNSVSPSSAVAALDVAYEFAGNTRVVAVVGHASSEASLAASQVYNAAGLVQIAPTSTAPVFDRAGPYSFRLVPSDTLQAEFLARTIAKHWPDARRVALVSVNDDYGRGLYRQLRPRLGKLVFDGVYADNADEWELADLGQQVAAHRPDLLVWLGRSYPLGLFLGELKAAVPDVNVLCADACDGTRIYRNIDGIFTGLMFVRFTDPRGDGEALQAFRDRYLTHAGELPSSEAILTYDAVSLIRAALQDGARTREQVRRYLFSLGRERPPFQGLGGQVVFDSTGTSARPYLLGRIVGRDSVIALAPREP